MAGHPLGKEDVYMECGDGIQKYLRVSMHSYALLNSLHSLLPLLQNIRTTCGKLILLGMTRPKIWKSRDILGTGNRTAESPVIVRLSPYILPC